jgi:UDP-N-acetylmuramoyl-tripeptide--D-alanyl-D-alanine ligase
MNKPLWNSKQLAAATAGKLENQSEWSVEKIVIDSRLVSAESLFVALKGERVDAHQFIPEILEKNSAALGENFPSSLHKNAKILRVENSFKALEEIGIYRRNQCGARIVGVTGSVGKTSTKRILSHLLSFQGATYATKGNFNNHIGVPLTLANMPENIDYAVIEMGMNHAGEIRSLTNQARPHVAIITAVAAAHLEFFDSIEGIADAKSEIMEGVSAGGFIVLDLDSPYYERLAKKAVSLGLNIISFGQNSQAKICLLSWNADGLSGFGEIKIADKTYKYKIGLPGIHQTKNACAAIAACVALGIEPEKVISALETLTPEEGRGVFREFKLSDSRKIFVIDDSYNANPASMEAGLRLLAEFNHPEVKRKIAVLGDMKELGDDSLALHKNLANVIAKFSAIDLVHTVGHHMLALNHAIEEKKRGHHAEDSLSLIPALKTSIQDKDLLLLKGSHSMHMELIIKNWTDS